MSTTGRYVEVDEAESKANSPSLVRMANTSLVLDAVRNHPPMSVEKMMSVTDLSRPTVMSIVRDLEAKSIVTQSGHAETRVGRQPTLYTIDRSAHFAIGIDVDGPPVRLVVSDLTGQVRHKASWSLDLGSDLTRIAESLIDAISEGLRQVDISSDQVVGIGLGLPASIDMRMNRAVNLTRLEALRDAPIADILNEATGIRVDVRNDAHLMALEEIERMGAATTCLYIAYRTGIGLAIVLDGRAYEGQTGNAGFFGHTTVDPNATECYCGSRGCLEVLASKRAICTTYRELGGEALTYECVMDAAASGRDLAAERAVTEAANYLGIGIANLIQLFDVYTVILGDVGCDEDHPFMHAVRQRVEENVATFLTESPRILLGQATDAEFALGGCRFQIAEFFSEPSLRLRV
jgi:predicted NBD/HSP70 family sugar kinase